MNPRIEQFKQQALNDCNMLLSRISEHGRWQRFEDIDVHDQSFYDLYNQEAWDIYVFSNCGLHEHQRKFQRCQMSERENFNNFNNDQEFNSARDLFHEIQDIKRSYNSLVKQQESVEIISQERIPNDVY